MPIAARRIAFTAIKQVEWDQVSLADELGPTEARVRAERTLVSAGTEIAIYSGSHIGYSTPGSRYPRLPYYAGYAFSGTVETVGSAVTAFKPGDRVLGSMGHQDVVVVDTSRGDLDLIPEGVSFEQACLTRLATISMQGVRLARVTLGENVAVFGQGLIGQFARQIAAIDGAAKLIGVDLIDTRLEIAKSHGATDVINPSRDDLATTIAAAVGERGLNVAIEATGNPTVINDALQSVGRFGRVILLGSPRGRLEIDPYRDIHSKGVTIIGAHANTMAPVPNPYYPWTLAEHRRLALELIRQGRLKTDGLVSHHYPAADALPIWDALMTRQQDFLGVIIDWT
jgi:2-desacetyl-2-hydroxyethyl bacteriochlorophyllide A dehydrogenase